MRSKTASPPLTSSATAHNLMLAHVARGGAFAPHVSQATIRQTIVAFRIGWTTYAIATLLTELGAIPDLRRSQIPSVRELSGLLWWASIDSDDSRGLG